MSEVVIPVSAEWKRRAYIDPAKYEDLYQASLRDPEAFWEAEARKLEWITPFKQVKDVSYDAKNLHIRWFYDGTLNVSVNCLDRHLKTRGGQTAIVWEADDPSVSRHISYAELHREVSLFANVLKANGVQ
jgi:acetyl-CoA synthetase